jgi:hypothetical protein
MGTKVSDKPSAFILTYTLKMEAAGSSESLVYTYEAV